MQEEKPQEEALQHQNHSTNNQEKNTTAEDKVLTERQISSEGEGEISAAGIPLAHNWKASIIAVWSGQAVSFVTSGAAGFALIWYLVETTGSALMLSLASVMYFLPLIIIGPLAGTFVDRHNRKYIMIASDIGIAIMTVITGALIFMGLANVYLVLIMIALRSVGSTFHGPAMLAAMPLLVPERHLVRISTLDQGLQGLANIGAPAFGILLYTTLGLPAALLLDALGAMVACVILVFVKIPDVHMTKEEQSTVLNDMKAGIAAIRERRGMTPFFVLIFVCTAMFMPMAALFPLMTTVQFGGDGYAASLVEAVWGFGFVVGSVVLGVWGGGKRLVPLILMSVLSCGVVTAICGFLSPDGFFIFILLAGLMAVFGAFFSSPIMAVIQKNIEPKKLGRVMAVFGALSGVAGPVGLLISGPIAEYVGVPPIFVASGAGMILTMLVALLFPSVFSLDKPSVALQDTSQDAGEEAAI